MSNRATIQGRGREKETRSSSGDCPRVSGDGAIRHAKHTTYPVGYHTWRHQNFPREYFIFETFHTYSCLSSWERRYNQGKNAVIRFYLDRLHHTEGSAAEPKFLLSCEVSLISLCPSLSCPYAIVWYFS